MPILEMLRGLPASGKSTYARDKAHRHPGEWIRVNKDDLRSMMHDGVWKGDKTEKQILAARDALILSNLLEGRNVISDDTNFGPTHELRLRDVAGRGKATFQLNDTFLAVTAKECIKRDLARPNSVGSKVINEMSLQYMAEKWKAPVYSDDLYMAIIVDIDGTIAHMNGRSPYDYSAVDTDLVDGVVHLLVGEAFNRGDKVIFVSGRDDKCKDITIDWLDEHGIAYDELHMRVTGDKRDDTIVKHEIYEAHIEGKFNVRYVLDDRDRVVDMWRAAGLKCLQVNAGDF